MKQLNHLLLGAALLLAPLASTIAQSTWETVDAITPWSGRAIVADAAGVFFSLAMSTNSTTSPVSTAVSVSSDTGLTWQTVGSIPGFAGRLTAAPDGSLYASGNRSATVSGKAFVWFSLDHGTNWTVSDPWTGQTQTNAFLAGDLAVGNSGVVYVCGQIFASSRWVVRKGQPTPSGISWSTVDNYPAVGLGGPNCIYVYPSGTLGQPDEVFVCGNANNYWTVRHSQNAGATWTTLDSYSVSMPPGNPNSLRVGTDGSIYTLGRITKTVNKSTQYGWLVRKSSNGGASWANVDYVVNGWPASASGLNVDTFGRIFAAGFLGTSPYTWLVRVSADSGATWTTSDLFLPTGYNFAQAWSVASDALGNICVVGDVENGTPSADLAPVRRLAAP